MFWNYFWTVVGTTIAIILAEIFGNYGLGDLVKDFFVGLFVKGKTFTTAQLARLEAKAAKIRASL